MQMKKQTISQYQASQFEPGSAPSRATVIRWLEKGQLAGEKIGGRWYVDAEQFDDYDAEGSLESVITDFEEKAERWLRNKDKDAESVAKMNIKRAKNLNRLPAWSDHDRMVQIYKSARDKQALTGVVHHVDHIVPLQGQNVCGLHVHENLQILPAAENYSKGNRFES